MRTRPLMTQLDCSEFAGHVSYSSQHVSSTVLLWLFLPVSHLFTLAFGSDPDRRYIGRKRSTFHTPLGKASSYLCSSVDCALFRNHQ